MTLGSLIKALKRQREGLTVMTNTGWSPGKAHPYPGNRAHVAFTPTTEYVRVIDFLEVCEQALNMPKPVNGGEYDRMGASPRVWMAKVGHESNQAIIDVVPFNGTIQLITEKTN